MTDVIYRVGSGDPVLLADQTSPVFIPNADQAAITAWVSRTGKSAQAGAPAAPPPPPPPSGFLFEDGFNRANQPLANSPDWLQPAQFGETAMPRTILIDNGLLRQDGSSGQSAAAVVVGGEAAGPDQFAEMEVAAMSSGSDWLRLGVAITTVTNEVDTLIFARIGHGGGVRFENVVNGNRSTLVEGTASIPAVPFRIWLTKQGNLYALHIGTYGTPVLTVTNTDHGGGTQGLRIQGLSTRISAWRSGALSAL